MGTRSPCFWKGVLGVALALGFGVGAASGCDPIVGVSIASHQGDETLRGPAVPVYGTASATDGLDYVRAALAGSLETDPFGVCLGSRAWSVEFDTTKISNGASKSLGATAFCCNVPAHEGSTGPIWVKIYNHYLIDVVERGHEDSYGSLRWKCLNIQGDGWDDMAGPWTASTEGVGPDLCEHKADTGSRHDMCTYKDTPPYLQSDAQDAKSYPSLPSEAVYDSHEGDVCGSYELTEWREEDNGDGNDYYTVESSGNVVGRYVVWLPNASGRCHTTAPYSDCLRTGIQIHGGKSVTDFQEALATTQDLKATHGCVRMHNGNLQTLVEDHIEVYEPRVNWGAIHIGVLDM